MKNILAILLFVLMFIATSFAGQFNPPGTNGQLAANINNLWAGLTPSNGLTVSGSNLSCVNSTSSVIGCVQGDGATLSINGSAVISVNQANNFTWSGTNTFSSIFNSTGTFEVGGVTFTWPASTGPALVGNVSNTLSSGATSTTTLTSSNAGFLNTLKILNSGGAGTANTGAGVYIGSTVSAQQLSITNFSNGTSYAATILANSSVTSLTISAAGSGGLIFTGSPITIGTGTGALSVISGVLSAGTLSTGNGGTNCSTASGTCLDNITGFSSTGFLKRTGAGAYSFITDPSDVTSVSNSDGTLTVTPTTGAVVASLALNHANTWTAVQTFTNSDLALLGASTGSTIFTSANSSSTTYTATIPANTGTIAELNLAQTFTATQTFPSASITNAELVNQSTTVNGQTCTLGGSCTVTASATLVVGTTSITSGTSGDILYNNGGVLGNGNLTGDVTTTNSLATTLATVNSNVGTFQGITVNAKGLVTAAVNQGYITGNQTITLSGGVTGSGATAITTTVTPDKAPAAPT